MLRPLRDHDAAAQSAPLHIHAIDIDAYLAALKENGAASVKEPGVPPFIPFRILAGRPLQIRFFQVNDF
jgi:hypothetical protein